jgi:site-specific recombinase XerD
MEPDMHIAEAVDDYLYGLRHRSVHTRRSARVALSLFAAWCNERGLELEHIKLVEIRRYTEHLYSRAARCGGTLSGQTLHNYLMRIKVFLRWCAKEEEFEDLIWDSCIA